MESPSGIRTKLVTMKHLRLELAENSDEIGCSWQSKWLQSASIALEVVLFLTQTNATDAFTEQPDHWHASLPKLPPPPTAVSASVLACSELDTLREPLSAAPTQRENMRKLESFNIFSCSKMKLAYVENETSQETHVGGCNSTPSNVRLLSREGVTKRLEGREHSRGC